MRAERRWSWIGLLALIGAAPLLLFPGGWRTLALIVLPVIWIGNRLVTGHFVTRTPYDLIMLGLLVMVLISLYATYDVAISLPKITGVLLGVSLFYNLNDFAIQPQRYGKAITGILVAIAVFVAVILIGTEWGRKLPFLGDIGAQLPAMLRGLPGADNGFHPAEVGGALTWIVFLPIAVVIGARSRLRARQWVGIAVLLLMLSVVMGLALLLTQSRSAWIGTAVGAGVILWFAGRWGKVLFGLGVALGLIAVLIIGPGRIFQAPAPPSTELGSVFTPDLSMRAEIWSRAIDGIQDYSLTGMGLGTFRYVMPVLYPVFTIAPDVNLGHAHNELLQAGVDLGVPGIIIFIALHLMAIGLAYQVIRSTAPDLMRWTAAGALAGLIAHGAFGLTDAVALGAKPGVFFWVLLTLITVTWLLAVQRGYSYNGVVEQRRAVER
jgi:putative inorganic carbon (HCO3(-)) transporter